MLIMDNWEAYMRNHPEKRAENDAMRLITVFQNHNFAAVMATDEIWEYAEKHMSIPNTLSGPNVFERVVRRLIEKGRFVEASEPSLTLISDKVFEVNASNGRTRYEALPDGRVRRIKEDNLNDQREADEGE